MRFAVEVIDAVAGEVGIERTGIRFSPNTPSQGIDEPNPEQLFTAIARELNARNVPWIELREPGIDSTFGKPSGPEVSPAMRPLYSGKIVLNSDYVGDTAQARLDEGVADAIAFGRPFIANPDLVERLRGGAHLASANPKTFYSQTAEGYTDYPTIRLSGARGTKNRRGMETFRRNSVAVCVHSQQMTRHPLVSLHRCARPFRACGR